MARQRKTEVLVVGAGPVGLMAACVLVHRGVEVTVIDRNYRTATHSYALALHGASLGLLDELGMARPLVELGRVVPRMVFYEGEQTRAEVDLEAAGGNQWPGVLVLPQSQLEWSLERELRRKGVPILWNHELVAVEQDEHHVLARVDKYDRVSSGYPVSRTEWVVAGHLDMRAAHVIGADGYESAVRQSLGVDYTLHGGRQCFSVYEFETGENLPDHMALCLDGETTDLFWPMPEGAGRWGIQIAGLDRHDPTPEALHRALDARAPWFVPRPERLLWSSHVLFEHRLAESFGRGRLWLAGDAAHLTGPAGNQSMNVGLIEARELAGLLADEIWSEAVTPQTVRDYDRRARARWRRLLNLEGRLRATGEADPWVAERLERLPPLLPACGEDLDALLGQLGLEASSGD